MKQIAERKKYIYPEYAERVLQIKGVRLTEWLIGIGGLAVMMFTLGFVGIVYGLLLIGFIYMACVRTSNHRQNFINQICSIISFSVSQKIILKKDRDSLCEEDDGVVNIDKKEERRHNKNKDRKPKKTKKEKKEQKNKIKNMQDLYPFKYIGEQFIKMENGDVYVFFKINANQLNFMSYLEIQAVMENFAKEIDRSKYEVGFFIQDSQFDIKHNINVAKKASIRARVPFLSVLAEQVASLIGTGKRKTIKKIPFLKIYIKAKDMEKVDVYEVINRTKKVFNETLHLSEPNHEEMKQMLAIFANRIFADNLPETELISEEEETELIVKKKKNYEFTQYPGIYNFKDLIVPVTAKFTSSYIQMGANFSRVYAVSSIITSTEETSILSEIVTNKGITTSIYVEPLSLSQYKVAAKNSYKSKKSTAGDDLFDEADLEMDTHIVRSSYQRVKEEKQKMYYVSIYFMLTASTLKELEEMEDKLHEECSNANLTIDPLETKQKMGWHSVHPLGRNELGKLIKQNIPSESVANLYPFSDNSFKDQNGLPIGYINSDNQEQLLFDLQQDRGLNRNVLVLGFSGIGKTVLLWLLIQNEALKGAYVRNLDIEGTCCAFFEKMGGLNINVSGNNEYCINPLQIRVYDEVKSGVVDDYISEVKHWMSIYKSSWHGKHLDLFESFLTTVYRDFKITNETNFSLLKPTDYPRMQDVLNKVIEAKESFNPISSLGSMEDINTLILGLNSCVNGADAKLFNRFTYLGEGDNTDIQLINFDISELMQSSNDRKLAQWTNVLTYITQFVRSNTDRSKFIMIVIDEIHSILKKKYISIVDIVDNCERTVRKWEGSFIKASQTIDEFDSQDDDMKGIVKPLFSQPAIKFLFHLGDMDYKYAKELLGLKDEEIALLKKKRKHKCLFRCGENVYDMDVIMPEWFKTVKADA